MYINVNDIQFIAHIAGLFVGIQLMLGIGMYFMLKTFEGIFRDVKAIIHFIKTKRKENNHG